MTPAVAESYVRTGTRVWSLHKERLSNTPSSDIYDSGREGNLAWYLASRMRLPAFLQPGLSCSEALIGSRALGDFSRGANAGSAVIHRCVTRLPREHIQGDWAILIPRVFNAQGLISRNQDFYNFLCVTIRAVMFECSPDKLTLVARRRFQVSNCYPLWKPCPHRESRVL